MITFLTVLIALVCILLMIAVLIQNPKGGGLDSTFGAAGNQMFGAAKSADFIEKATWGLAATLLVLCLVTSLVVKSNRPSTTPPQGSNLEYKMPQQNEPAETFYF